MYIVVPGALPRRYQSLKVRTHSLGISFQLCSICTAESHPAPRSARAAATSEPVNPPPMTANRSSRSVRAPAQIVPERAVVAAAFAAKREPPRRAARRKDEFIAGIVVPTWVSHHLVPGIYGRKRPDPIHLYSYVCRLISDGF